MEQRKSTVEDQSGAAPPPWMHRTAHAAPERRAKMLEHMARARSLPQAQAAPAPVQSGKSGTDLLGDLIGYIILSGFFALVFMSRIPLYIGAFLFLSDGERIETVLSKVGIRFEPDTIGPDLVKGFASWFGWFALLASLKGSAPALIAPWLPPTESWSLIAGIALLLASVEACAAFAVRQALPWFGWQSWPNSLTWTTIKLVIAIGVLALLILLAAL
ncbi:hypothetical protein PMI42_00752 [Bradyrhizobium sp. YR681]|uniref:hypothetical protein n=1 Tax=Bradyrhizobium sp. YR681 TaxID=1144344 RepID=UPI000270E6AC|nr:hypothetical protein [Bradyrhizobium sp. YR681]EJN15734.1 hypothetical protein PMI42_00752 [Bradyrhizobium sp. YR681]